MLLFWSPKDPPGFSLLARFDPALRPGKDAQISPVSLVPSALRLSVIVLLCPCFLLSEFFLPQPVLFGFSHVRTVWSFRGKGNYCSYLQPRKPVLCKSSCAACVQAG